MFTAVTKTLVTKKPLRLPFACALALALAGACGSAAAPRSLPEDPARRQIRMEYARREILFKTTGVAPQRYRAVVRPALVRRLGLLGFTPEEIAVILEGVDPARRDDAPGAG